MKPTQEQLQGALRAARRKGSLCAAERYLQRKGILCFGVESVSCADRSIDYVNLGDTYDTTIIQEGDEFSISSWGGWYEETEQEHCESEGEIRCGYCGEFTPVAEDWRDTVCQHCGRYVQTGEKPEPQPAETEKATPVMEKPGEETPVEEIPANAIDSFKIFLNAPERN